MANTLLFLKMFPFVFQYERFLSPTHIACDNNKSCYILQFPGCDGQIVAGRKPKHRLKVFSFNHKSSVNKTDFGKNVLQSEVSPPKLIFQKSGRRYFQRAKLLNRRMPQRLTIGLSGVYVKVPKFTYTIANKTIGISQR